MTGAHTPPSTLPPVPPLLAAQGFQLRSETGEDIDFLSRLYISTRWEELQQTGWTDAQKQAFLHQQFTFQYTHYQQHYADAARGILQQDDIPRGRLYLLQMPGDLRIVDISLLPEWRGQGIGAALIGAVFELARSRRSIVSIHVESFNPARRLYDRLGFQEVADLGVYRRMQWTPPDCVGGNTLAEDTRVS